MHEAGVVGVFSEPGAAARAVGALRAAGGAEVRLAMPGPFTGPSAALGRPRSRLGWVTFLGALAGMAAGIALTVGTSVAWPLVTGGKPIVSLPPFVIVIFELTVLFGSLVNLAALVVAAWRGERRRPFPALDRFRADRIGVFAAGGDPALSERILRDAGAEEVSRVG